MIKVNKGWSNDEKYLVFYQSQICFLRVSPIEQQSRVEKNDCFYEKESMTYLFQFVNQWIVKWLKTMCTLYTRM